MAAYATAGIEAIPAKVVNQGVYETAFKQLMVFSFVNQGKPNSSRVIKYLKNPTWQ